MATNSFSNSQAELLMDKEANEELGEENTCTTKQKIGRHIAEFSNYVEGTPIIYSHPLPLSIYQRIMNYFDIP